MKKEYNKQLQNYTNGIKRYRNILAFLALFAIVVVCPLRVCAQQADVYAPIFNAEYYYGANPDLAQNIGNQADALLAHFLENGMAEGRSGDGIFYPLSYAAANPDLQAVYGDDLRSYYMHYINCGLAEGRLAAPAGDVLGNTAENGLCREVVRLVNAERSAAGLSELTISSKLSESAMVRAKEIKTRFSHTRPDGTSCFTAVDRTGYRSLGENIAAGHETPEEVVTAWMNSTGHRENILGDFTDIGIGYYEDGAPHWVQIFGKTG